MPQTLSLHSQLRKVVLLFNLWEHSSVGSEHLPYKQRVRGSSPCAPTEEALKEILSRLLYLHDVYFIHVK
jgi:hypothetical protein